MRISFFTAAILVGASIGCQNPSVTTPQPEKTLPPPTRSIEEDIPINVENQEKFISEIRALVNLTNSEKELRDINTEDLFRFLEWVLEPSEEKASYQLGLFMKKQATTLREYREEKGQTVSRMDTIRLIGTRATLVLKRNELRKLILEETDEGTFAPITTASILTDKETFGQIQFICTGTPLSPDESLDFMNELIATPTREERRDALLARAEALEIFILKENIMVDMNYQNPYSALARILGLIPNPQFIALKN